MAIDGSDKKGIMLVVVVSLLIVLVVKDDLGMCMKGNNDGGVGISTRIFAIHLESSICAAESFW
jgi:hypothetical protein